MLDRYTLFDYFYSLRPQIVGKSLKINDFQRLVSNQIRSSLPVKVLKRVDFTTTSGCVFVGGLYWSQCDEAGISSIEIHLHYNICDDQVKLTNYKFRRFCNVLVDTVFHEMIHMRQYRRRLFKSLPDYNSVAESSKQRKEQAYLGHADEIDAYSFNMACELMRKLGNDKRAVERYLKKTPSRKRTRSSTLDLYMKTFNWDQDHKIIKKLKSRTIRYLPYAELGKPYKTSDWINR
jgi:hypothetical protein